ncbi:MAG: thiamine pyrophosphate-dependent dehydrogenase E1 component subunit alpha [Candidatus Bathyarchaeia archaeon]
MSISKDLALTMYERMLLIREFEEKVREYFAAGKIPGFVHLYVGEEGVAVGVAANLRRDDVITSTHRGHGHCIAKGCDVKQMFAEITGKKTGMCKGKGGSMHIADFDVGMLGANGIVGGGVPHAVGAALAFKLKRTDRVAVAFFGDGAMNQGVVMEAMNLAAIWKLPVIFVVEDNQYAISLRSTNPTKLQPRVSTARSYAERALGFGIPAVSVDGQDVFAVYEVAREAISKARRGEGPSLIHTITYRYYGHFEGDPLVYRSREEEREWRERDPIIIAKRRILEMGLASPRELELIERKAREAILEAVKFAEESPYPEPEEAFSDVFLEGYY